VSWQTNTSSVRRAAVYLALYLPKHAQTLRRRFCSCTNWNGRISIPPILPTVAPSDGPPGFTDLGFKMTTPDCPSLEEIVWTLSANLLNGHPCGCTSGAETLQGFFPVETALQ